MNLFEDIEDPYERLERLETQQRQLMLNQAQLNQSLANLFTQMGHFIDSHNKLCEDYERLKKAIIPPYLHQIDK